MWHKSWKNHDYLCEVAIDKIEEFDREIQKGLDSLEFAEYKKNLKGKGSEKAKHLRSVRNFENNFPNGLYLKEAKAILNNQQKYYPEITNDFIEVCEDIISARIPYYIGPLKNDAKNAWVKKNGKIKYSYKYAQKHNTISPVDEYVTIKAWKDRMRSHCTYLPEEFALPKGSFIAETFSIVNELNILEARDLDENTYYLTFKDKVKIFDNLFLKGGDVKYKDIIDLLGLSYFGPRRASKIEGKMNNKYTLYSSIVRSVPELKVNSIMELFSENKELKDKIDEIEDIILSINLYNEEKTKIDFFVNEKNYSENVAKAFSRLKSNSFFALSKAFIMDKKIGVEGETLLSLLFEDNSFEHPNEQMYHITNAVDENGVALDFSSNKYEEKLKKNGGKLGIDLLMDGTSPVIPVSRTVIRGLNEALKVYDELVKAFGVPKRVVIETARDLKDHTVIKEQSVKHYEDKERFYKSIDEQLKKNKNYKASSGLEKWDQIKPYVTSNKKKIDLYLCQNGIDLLTGEKININHLEDYEIDHILPRGFGDDSMDDKMLISKLANAKKGDRFPLQFIESGEQIGNRIVTSGEFVNRVEMLYDMKLISDNKKKRLLLENTNDLDKFINQNLVDTRYIIKEFASILNAYNKYHDYETHIVSLKAAYTHQYRKSFNFDKDRGFGDQHHAHDAALLIVADKTLSTYYPNYDSRNINNNKKVSSDKYKTYQQLIKDMLSADKKDKGFDEFLRTMFYKAYGISWNNDYSIISQIKKIVPFYSNKVEKNYMGKFFDATILKQKEYDENAVLSILEVNNDKHIFSSINCAAVDFYRYTVEKKGKKEAKHIAIHIPKVIIKTNGEIDKEKYIKLIKEHYKAPELLDENGEIKEGYFRFRAYKNDIIYNTATECPMLFNIGSIVNYKLELKFINAFSYNDIYLEGRRISNDLIKYFDIKTKNNPNGIDYKLIEKEKIANYMAKNYWHLDESNKKIKSACELISNDNNIYDLSNRLAFIGLIINRSGTPPTLKDTKQFGANNKDIETNPDNEYIKLKYNILGLRFIENPFGKLIIESPKQIQGAYSKIRKEKFYWNISKEEL